VDFAAAVFNQLGLATIHKHDGSAGATHVVGLEALIQHQYGSVYHMGGLAVF